MHEIHIAIVIAGVVISSLLVAIYLWARDKLSYQTWLNCSGFGLVLGLVANGSLYIAYLLFAFIIAAYVAYFIHLKSSPGFNFTTESTMGSLFSGVVIGIFGLLGCIICA